MRAVDFKSSTWTFVFWVFTLIAGAVCILAQAFPVPLSFLNEETLFVAVVELALAFVLVAWPLMIPRSLRDCEGSREEILNIMLQIMVMMLFAMPVLLIARSLSGIGVETFVVGYGLVLGAAALVGSIHLAARSFGIRVGPWYYLAVFVTQAMIPYFGYLVLELSATDASGFVRTFCPFISILEIGSGAAAMIHAVSFFGVAIALGIGVHLRARRGAVQA